MDRKSDVSYVSSSAYIYSYSILPACFRSEETNCEQTDLTRPPENMTTSLTSSQTPSVPVFPLPFLSASQTQHFKNLKIHSSKKNIKQVSGGLRSCVSQTRSSALFLLSIKIWKWLKSRINSLIPTIAEASLSTDSVNTCQNELMLQKNGDSRYQENP